MRCALIPNEVCGISVTMDILVLEYEIDGETVALTQLCRGFESRLY